MVLITASYREQEFVRVGYYVTNEYEDMELRENPPTEPQFTKLIRTIAANEPRVTKFKINWDSSSAVAEAAAAAAAAASTSASATAGENAAATDGGIDAAMMEINHPVAIAPSTASNHGHSINASLIQVSSAPSGQNVIVNENKENILLEQQQQKLYAASTADAKLGMEQPISQNMNSNQFVENSYDSIMN